MIFFNKAIGIAVLMGCCLLAGVQGAAAKDVVDQAGRTVSVPDDPRRIVALAPSITELIFALGCRDRLVGVTRYSNFPRSAQKLPKVGSYVHLDLEKIVALQPDLCIAIRDGNPKAVVQRLESMGIPVYVVDPRNLDTVMETLTQIGALLNASNRAREQVATMQARINDVNSRIARARTRPTVFFQIDISPIVSVGSDTFIHEIIVAAGGTNLAAGPVAYPRFSREQVLALAPEVLIVTSMSRAAVFEKVKSRWRQWREMPAVKHHRIHLVDSNVFDRPSPRLVEALEVLARLIHPELFETQP